MKAIIWIVVVGLAVLLTWTLDPIGHFGVVLGMLIAALIGAVAGIIAVLLEKAFNL